MDTIYVLAKDGRPLMPSHSYRKVKRLLKEGRASVVQTKPFTIRLRYEIEEPAVSECTLGIDPGRTNIGLCVIDEEGRVLFASDAITRNKQIKRYLEDRKRNRQASRRGERKRCQRRAIASDKTGMARHTEFWRMLPGYKKPVCCKVIRNQEAKFNNRKRRKGWLTPSAHHLLLTHENLINKVMGLLPVSAIAVEINRFDFARIENPDIRRWDYQKGRLYGFKDVFEAVSCQQKGRCLLCRKDIGHYHHIVPKSRGGSNTIENIAGLCIPCHDKVHKEMKAVKRLESRKKGLLKKYGALSVLNQIMPYLLDDLAAQYDVYVTTGYDTERIREFFGFGKDHYVDAWCIAMSSIIDVDELPKMPSGRPCQDPGFPDARHDIRQFRRHDRANIKAQKERTYYLDGHAVCKNRHKRTGQTDDSLAEFRQKHPKDVSRLTAKRSTRSYNNKDRVMPGAVFVYKRKRYVLTSQQRGGTCWHADGLPKNGVNAKECKVIAHNTGLVFI